MDKNFGVQPGGDAIIEKVHRCAEILRLYNNTPDENIGERDSLLSELLGGRGRRLRIMSPFYANFGCNIFLGENCFINMNCTFLDDGIITIGSYAMIAPDVKIYTAFHPMTAEERWGEKRVIAGFEYPVTYTLPVTIGDNVWIGGNSVIMPGVTIGDNCVIGAGSIVTKDIPSNTVAYGNPCRAVRENI